MPMNIDYDCDGAYIGPRETYRASGNVVAVAGVAPFLVIGGVLNKTIRIQRIRLTGFTLTALQYLRVALAKYTALPTGGTPVAITSVPTDSSNQAAPAIVNAYTAAPAPGGLVGNMTERTVLAPATAAAAGSPPADIDFQLNEINDIEAIALNGAAECVGVLFPVAPASAVTLSFEIEYTQDGAPNHN